MLEKVVSRLNRNDALEVAYFTMRILRYRRLLPNTTREYLIEKGTAPPPQHIGAHVRVLLEEIEKTEHKRIDELDDETADRYAEELARIARQRTFEELHCERAPAIALLLKLREGYESNI